MKAVAVFPDRKRLSVIDAPSPAIERPTRVKLRMLDRGVCGTDKEICAVLYGAPPAGMFPISAQRYAPGVVHLEGELPVAEFEPEPWLRQTFRLPGGIRVTQQLVVRNGREGGVAWTLLRRKLAGPAAGSVTLTVRLFFSGRDTFIALRGLCLAVGRLEEARAMLVEWAGAVSVRTARTASHQTGWTSFVTRLFENVGKARGGSRETTPKGDPHGAGNR